MLYIGNKQLKIDEKKHTSNLQEVVYWNYAIKDKMKG